MDFGLSKNQFGHPLAATKKSVNGVDRLVMTVTDPEFSRPLELDFGTSPHAWHQGFLCTLKASRTDYLFDFDIEDMGRRGFILAQEWILKNARQVRRVGFQHNNITAVLVSDFLEYEWKYTIPHFFGCEPGQGNRYKNIIEGPWYLMLAYARRNTPNSGIFEVLPSGAPFEAIINN